jgi:Electron transfer DM13
MKFKFLGSIALLLLLASCTPTPSSNTSTNNDSTISTATPTATPTVVSTTEAKSSGRSGSFVAGEHPTEGRVSIINENGKNFIEFDQSFKTDKGPDLFVVLHRSKDVLKASNPPSYPIKEGEYINISPLQNVSGTQRYEIPGNVTLSDYNSVAIWCRQFNVTFGTAALSS